MRQVAARASHASDKGLTRIWPRVIEQGTGFADAHRDLRMPIRIDSRSADFTGRFNAFLSMKREVSSPPTLGMMRRIGLSSGWVARTANWHSGL